MEFLFGILGAGAGLGLFFAGVKAGREGPAPKPREEQQTRRLREDQEALAQLQNYTAEQAYGLLGRREAGE